MAINRIGENENNPTTNSDEYYENVAGQEEIYLERIEENLRAIAICELNASRTAENRDRNTAIKLKHLRQLAVDCLIESDSDDPPLPREHAE